MSIFLLSTLSTLTFPRSSPPPQPFPTFTPFSLCPLLPRTPQYLTHHSFFLSSDHLSLVPSSLFLHLLCTSNFLFYFILTACLRLRHLLVFCAEFSRRTDCLGPALLLFAACVCMFLWQFFLPLVPA